MLHIVDSIYKMVVWLFLLQKNTYHCVPESSVNKWQSGFTCMVAISLLKIKWCGLSSCTYWLRLLSHVLMQDWSIYLIFQTNLAWVQMFRGLFFEKSKLGILYVFLQASMVKLPEDEDTPEKRVNRIFNQMDTVPDTLLILDLTKDPQL